MRVEHILPPDLMQNRAIRVLVVGAGGTGSAIVNGIALSRPGHARLGRRYGIAVTLMDADVVSEN
jgi:molybdopterin/thiamine biosynthesis adenylyltransferase